jgi:hypothetical protein
MSGSTSELPASSGTALALPVLDHTSMWATTDEVESVGVDVEELLLAEAFRDAWPQGRPHTWNEDAPDEDEVEANQQRQERGGNNEEEEEEEDPDVVYDPEEDDVEGKEAWEQEMDDALQRELKVFGE